MSPKGVALTGYLVVVGGLLLYSETAVLVGLGVALIALAAVAAVTASNAREPTGDRRAGTEPPAFESNN